MNRRDWLNSFGMGLGGLALADMLGRTARADAGPELSLPPGSRGGVLDAFHVVPKAKRVIYLFQSGGPSQLDLFDHKPLLEEKDGEQLPDSVRGGQRLTGMSGNQSSIPLAASPFRFARHGDSGAEISELLPHTAKIADRGMLDDTLVVWGGEFGRTNYCQGLYKPGHDFGRDHHPRCFTIWMAGGGVKPGITWGETDEWGYNLVKDGVHVHDFHATLMHLMGIDHERLTYKFQGRRYRLTDVHGKVVKGILA